MTPQNMIALAAATEMRQVNDARRARVKAALTDRAGFALLAKEIEAGGRWPKLLTVDAVLRWPERSYRAQRVAIRDRAGISETTTVMGMTDRQRRALVVVLRDPPGRSGR